jgi:hypothetical protein
MIVFHSDAIVSIDLILFSLFVTTCSPPIFTLTCAVLVKKTKIENSITPISALILAEIIHSMKKTITDLKLPKIGVYLCKNELFNNLGSEVGLFHLHFFTIILHFFQHFSDIK